MPDRWRPTFKMPSMKTDAEEIRMAIGIIGLVAGTLFNLPCHAQETFKFNFKPGTGVDKNQRFIGRSAGPCGDTLSASVSSIPKASKDEPLQADAVYEVDSKGHVLFTWFVPLDSIPVALQEDALIFEQTYSGNTLTYKVAPNGSVSRWPKNETLPKSEHMESGCPVGATFEGSAHASCVRLRDVKSKAVRLVAFWVPCT